jgi:hypothetical protein
MKSPLSFYDMVWTVISGHHEPTYNNDNLSLPAK